MFYVCVYSVSFHVIYGGHWAIANKSPYVRDVVLGKDASHCYILR